MGEEIENFLMRMRTLTEWLDKVEGEVDKLDTISISPEELSEQSSVLEEVWFLFFEYLSLGIYD